MTKSVVYSVNDHGGWIFQYQYLSMVFKGWINQRKDNDQNPED